MGRKIISVFLIAWILLVMPMAVFAEELDMDRVGSISVTLVDPDGEKPLVGAELSLYYVATVKLNEANRPSYTFTDAFVGCGAALDDPALTTVLDVFVQENATPVAKQVTDAQGAAVFIMLSKENCPSSVLGALAGSSFFGADFFSVFFFSVFFAAGFFAVIVFPG